MICAALVAALAGQAFAGNFFSTEKSDKLFTIGLRAGVNTYNRTIKPEAFPDCYSHQSWGVGFSGGVVAALNIRDYLAIQPGFFYESRNGGFTLMGSATGSGLAEDGSNIAQAGRIRTYNFTIPVMALIRFNVTDNVKWNVEAGPYVSFLLNSDLTNKKVVTDGPAEFPLFGQDAAGVDFGFKLGTAIELFNHYYVGAHYMAGMTKGWKDLEIANITKNFGGSVKGWVFTIGYDF